jgi:hypothetical protein
VTLIGAGAPAPAPLAALTLKVTVPARLRETVQVEPVEPAQVPPVHT